MSPIIIIITPGAVVTAAAVLVAVLSLRAALRRRPIPRSHGLNDVP